MGSLPHKVLSYPHTESGARLIDTRDVGEVAAKLLLACNELNVNSVSCGSGHMTLDIEW